MVGARLSRPPRAVSLAMPRSVLSDSDPRRDLLAATERKRKQEEMGRWQITCGALAGRDVAALDQWTAEPAEEATPWVPVKGPEPPPVAWVQCRPKELALAMHAFAAAALGAHAVLGHLAGALLRAATASPADAGGARASDLALGAWALSRTPTPLGQEDDPGTAALQAAELARFCLQSSPGAASITRCLSALAWLRHPPDAPPVPGLTHAAEEVLGALPDGEAPAAVAEALWAAATMRMTLQQSAPLVQLATDIVARTEQVHSGVAAQLFWACAALRRDPTRTLLSGLRDAIECSDGEDPIAVAQAVWAAARLELGPVARRLAAVADEPCIAAIAAQRAELLPTLLWALAKAEAVDVPQVPFLAARAAAAGPVLPLRALSIAAWACAQLVHSNRALWRAVAVKAGATERAAVQPVAVSQALCAAAHLLERSERLAGALCRAALSPACIERCGPQDVANIQWALAALRHYPGGLLRQLPHTLFFELDRHCHQRRVVRRMEPQHLANTLWAHAQLTLPPPDTYMAEVAARTGDAEFDPSNAGQAVLALARLEERDPAEGAQTPDDVKGLRTPGQSHTAEAARHLLQALGRHDAANSLSPALSVMLAHAAARLGCELPRVLKARATRAIRSRESVGLTEWRKKSPSDTD
eukprot:TRINITY_DN16326_c0_g2_i1.p1 TRINITY_DN16326_c0_g2~~TRINITY_DN16326_c0_g2_i1.p1  ORF type:complete len:673 (+),score=153.21 TRINITY_DN16326_c0_g2_i1:79-2019(+)